MVSIALYAVDMLFTLNLIGFVASAFSMPGHSCSCSGSVYGHTLDGSSLLYSSFRLYSHQTSPPSVLFAYTKSPTTSHTSGWFLHASIVEIPYACSFIRTYSSAFRKPFSIPFWR